MTRFVPKGPGSVGSSTISAAIISTILYLTSIKQRSNQPLSTNQKSSIVFDDPYVETNHFFTLNSFWFCYQVWWIHPPGPPSAWLTRIVDTVHLANWKCHWLVVAWNLLFSLYIAGMVDYIYPFWLTIFLIYILYSCCLWLTMFFPERLRWPTRLYHCQYPISTRQKICVPR